MSDHSQNNYSAKDIQVLEGLEAVRMRPGMYIGNTDSEGILKMIFEVIDNSLDEFMAGHGSEIYVKIEKNEQGQDLITVKDYGRGIPVDLHAKVNRPAMEVIMTTLHAGGKFSNDAYQMSGGLHGVGVSVVNALAEYCEVNSYRDGYHYRQKYSKGIPLSDVEKLEALSDPSITGTEVLFIPDRTILSGDIIPEILMRRIKEIAFLNPGLTMYLEDRRDEKNPIEEKFHFPQGVVSFLRDFNKDRDVLPKEPIVITSKQEKIEIEIVLQYTQDTKEFCFVYANNIRNEEGGLHLDGFRRGLLKFANEMIDYYKFQKEVPKKFVQEDIREGFTGVLNIKVMNPIFKNQTKDKLIGSEENISIDQIVRDVTYEKLLEFSQIYPNEMKVLVERLVLAYKGREAARRARESVKRKSILDTQLGLPGKLADVSEKNPELCELFIVEGDSAGGSAKQGRNREFQAILPLRGKLANVEKLIDATALGGHTLEDKLLQSDTILPLIQAIGTGIGTGYQEEKLRYHKIIIMADADVDGSHIISLLLTFFYRYMIQLIEKGYLYVAVPPLYKLQLGKLEHYVYSDEEKAEILEKWKKEGKSVEKVDVQRYKGLGEMNAQQLWETTMNPEVRKLIQIKVYDPIHTEEVFTMLMGKRVQARREFIEQHARFVDFESLTI